MNTAIVSSLICRRGGSKCAKLLNQKITSSVVSSSPQRWLMTTSVLKNWEENETFWQKNDRLKRPMSPHLTIYKPQITTMLSITHRGTGCALAAVLYGFSMGMMICPQSFGHCLTALENMHMGGACIFALKFTLAFPFCFHFANGIRHLAWDVGQGFEMKTLYQSGYAVLGIAALGGLLLAMM